MQARGNFLSALFGAKLHWLAHHNPQLSRTEPPLTPRFHLAQSRHGYWQHRRPRLRDQQSNPRPEWLQHALLRPVPLRKNQHVVTVVQRLARVLETSPEARAARQRKHIEQRS